jgi:amino acid transporter
VFSIAAVFSFWVVELLLAYAFIAVAFVFLIITLVRSDALLPLNKLWMRFGLLLGMIVSPIVLGIIFFGLFTPIATLMRLGRRDELRLKFVKKSSHWITRSEPIKSESFKNQF